MMKIGKATIIGTITQGGISTHLRPAECGDKTLIIKCHPMSPDGIGDSELVAVSGSLHLVLYPSGSGMEWAIEDATYQKAGK